MRSDVATEGLAASAPEGSPSGGARRELLLRVVSALVMAPLGLWSVYSGGLALIIATGFCAVVAAFEWTRMASQTKQRWAQAALTAVLMATGIGAVFAGAQDLGLVAIASLLGCAAASALAIASGASLSSMAFGSIYVTLPFGCFVWIREAAPTGGQLFLMAILAIIWTTDIAAYFAGRGFGGPLLSPKDSPNKTWTGAIGAVVCAALAGAAVARGAGADFMHWLLFGVAMSIVGQAGDLLESRFKRLYGVKDTSGIVPGHGGVLDRLDALMAATVVAALTLKFAPGLAPVLATGPAA